MRSGWLLVALLFVSLAVSPAAGDINGYERLSDWGLLGRLCDGVTAGIASSYDRAGGNRDYNWYESSTQRESGDVDPVTVTTLEGPGVITRFWMPHAAANMGFKVRMTVDGVLRIDTTSDVMLSGLYGGTLPGVDYPYMDAPLISTLVGGQVSYEPIVFSQSVVIESNNRADTRHYYQYNYLKLPAGTSVTPYNGQLTAAQQAARTQAASTIATVGANPGGVSGSSVTLDTSPQSIATGMAVTLCDVTGSGRIRGLKIKMPDGASDAELDGLRIRVRYDGRSVNAVDDVPVSHFFGAGHGRVAYESLPLGASETNGFYSYWPMPYRQSVVVELRNDSGAAISIESASVEYEAGAVGADAAYLHAKYGYVESTTAPRYQLLRTGGRGHYVGNLLWVDRRNIGDDGWPGRSLLESDDIVTVNVDGDSPTVLGGTGLEDAYNGGYYYNHVAEQPDEPNSPQSADPYSGIAPYHGLLRMNFTDTDDYVHTDQYRWLVPDPVPFTDGIDVKVENIYRSQGASFGSVAFYYLMPELGDANGDGAVDIEDFAILRATLGQTGESQAADFDGSGTVDTEDLVILQASFGLTDTLSPAPPASAAVPEPSSLVLLCVSAGAFLSAARRGRK